MSVQSKMNWWTSSSHELEHKGVMLDGSPDIVAQLINYIFKQLWGKVILSDMHPIGQILNFDDCRDYQGRGTEHFLAPLHVEGAPKVDVIDQ